MYKSNATLHTRDINEIIIVAISIPTSPRYSFLVRTLYIFSRTLSTLFCSFKELFLLTFAFYGGIIKSNRIHYYVERRINLQNRIKALRKELNLTQEKFGERLGMKKNSISQIENGINALTEQLLVSICREFNVNEEWLRTGEGGMFVTLNRTQQIAQLTADLFKGEKDSFKERLLLALAKLNEDEWKVLEKIATDLTKEKD